MSAGIGLKCQHIAAQVRILAKVLSSGNDLHKSLPANLLASTIADSSCAKRRKLRCSDPGEISIVHSVNGTAKLVHATLVVYWTMRHIHLCEVP